MNDTLKNLRSICRQLPNIEKKRQLRLAFEGRYLGLTFSKIGKILSVSRQRAEQLYQKAARLHSRGFLYPSSKLAPDSPRTAQECCRRLESFRLALEAKQHQGYIAAANEFVRHATHS